MKNIKIITIVGARPQFIKAAVVSRAIISFNSRHRLSTDNQQLITEIIIHTGQHYDQNMSVVFFREMQIPEPAYNLDINGLDHGAMTGQMLEKIEQVLLKEKPDLVLVYGDTNSTLAGALAAKKLHIKVAHVEAGLRSFNLNMPEEINRILVDRISDILFCPTETAVNNLKKEGYPNIINHESRTTNHQLIVNVGDVMYDAVLFYEKNAIQSELEVDLKKTPFILVTLHRAENTDDSKRLKSIFDAFIEISGDMPVILPLHPRTRKKLQLLEHNYLDIIPKTLCLIPPVSYLEMIWLLKNCRLIMTDSGGLQKEAFFFKKPCITLREETEWIELVENKYNFIAGYESSDIILNYQKIKNIQFNFSKKPYGKGNAGELIVEHIYRYFGLLILSKYNK